MVRREGRPTQATFADQPPVFVQPGVDPAKMGAVAGYQAGITARRGSKLPKAPMELEQKRPAIPLLTGGPSRDGRTMHEHALEERAAAAPPPPTPRQGPSIIAEPAPVPKASRALPPLSLQPQDVLPPQAQEDPAYVHGFGSDIAINQPQMAAKYGVVRNGQTILPQQLVPAAHRTPGKLRDETVQDLETLQRLQSGRGAPGLDQDDIDARKAVSDGLGGSAARVGGVSTGDPVKPVGETEEDRARVLKEAINRMDSFEFSQWRQLMMRQILHSEEERTLIESRLDKLNLGDLLVKGVIRQRIPIRPGEYELTLQSYEGQVELALKRLVMLESRSVDVGEQYLLDKHSFMSVAVGLHKVNDKVYPDIVDSEGVFSDKLFLDKFNMVMRLPIHMLASIGVNLMWFEMRVRKLYSATAVGNG